VEKDEKIGSYSVVRMIAATELVPADTQEATTRVAATAIRGKLAAATIA